MFQGIQTVGVGVSLGEWSFPSLLRLEEERDRNLKL